MRSGSNQIDKDGKKQGLWYERFKVRYGQLGYNTVYIGKYKGGKREGVWKHYYKTMIIHGVNDSIVDSPNFSYNIYKHDTLHFFAKAIYHHGELEGKFIYKDYVKTYFKHNKINGLYEYDGLSKVKYYCKDNKIVTVILSSNDAQKIGEEPFMLYYLRPYTETDDYTKYQKDRPLIEK